MRIYVTKKDIKVGAPGSICGCPISLAIKRRLKWEMAVSTYGFAVYIHDETGTKYSRFVLPKEAAAFVDAFDAGKSVKPFRFTLP